MNLFVDTSAFVALTDKSDNYHQQAKTFAYSLKPNVVLVTTNFVLNESITKIRMDIGPKQAVEFRESIIGSKIHRIHYVTASVEEEAFKIFKKYTDKELSFTDCVSFALMKILGISSVFAFDDDFEKVGFNMLP